MPGPVTERRLAANRRNAQRSTGPRSPEGKARVRTNALKHGLLAREVLVLEGDGAETRADFDALLADLVAELQPRGVIEETLVERIATGYWRLRRAQRYEVGSIRAALDTCQRPDGEPVPGSVPEVRAQLDATSASLAEHQRRLQILDHAPDLTARETFMALLPALTNRPRGPAHALTTHRWPGERSA